MDDREILRDLVAGLERGRVPALTIWQPWAQVIALGLKDVENRTWYPRGQAGVDRLGAAGGWVLIHAGRLVNRNDLDAIMDLRMPPPPEIVALARGFAAPNLAAINVLVGANPRLISIASVARKRLPHDIGYGLMEPHRLIGAMHVDGPRRHYDVARKSMWQTADARVIGWGIDHAVAFATPIPCKGQRGLWFPAPELLTGAGHGLVLTRAEGRFRMVRRPEEV